MVHRSLEWRNEWQYLQMTLWGRRLKAPASFWAMSSDRYFTPAPNDTTTKPCSSVFFTQVSNSCTHTDQIQHRSTVHLWNLWWLYSQDKAIQHCTESKSKTEHFKGRYINQKKFHLTLNHNFIWLNKPNTVTSLFHSLIKSGQN